MFLIVPCCILFGNWGIMKSNVESNATLNYFSLQTALPIVGDMGTLLKVQFHPAQCYLVR